MDDLNRMTSLDDATNVWNYAYRADGMRTSKIRGAGGSKHTAYAYDGQMPIEEHNTGTVWPVHFVELVCYFRGARGIDYIEKYTDRDTIISFPIYDGHGNMIATIGRSNNSPYYSLGDQRVYDVWGQIRSGSTATQPKMRYCANLGHPTDDESGLIYMRARYYEPWTGRFVSEDAAIHGLNWFVYAGNNPVSKVDFGGQVVIDELLSAIWELGILGFFAGGGKTALQQYYEHGEITNKGQVLVHGMNGLLVAYLTNVVYKAPFMDLWKDALRAGQARGEAMPAIIAAITYTITISLFLIAIDFVLDELVDSMFGWK